MPPPENIGTPTYFSFVVEESRPWLMPPQSPASVSPSKTLPDPQEGFAAPVSECTYAECLVMLRSGASTAAISRLTLRRAE